MNLKNINWKTFSILDVVKGCADHYLPDWRKVPERVKAVAKYRMQICGECSMNDNDWCDNSGNRHILNVETGMEVIGCGCNLSCKSTVLHEFCPAAKWKAVNEG